MIRKNLQITNKVLLINFFLLMQASVGVKSHSLDLKVDLPPNSGKEPVLYYNPVLNHQADTHSNKISKFKEENTEKRQNNIEKKELRINYYNEDVPPLPPSLENKNKLHTNESKQNIKNQNLDFYSKDNEIVNSIEKTGKQIDPFPMLSCIKDNVKFWSRVYTEIDVNEAFIHDKNNLSRVYASIMLPQDKQQQITVMNRERKKYENILRALINKPAKSWTKEEIKISKLFNKNELTINNIQDAIANVRVQTGLKSQFEAGIQRSINHLPSIYPIVKKSGLPLELVLLPHVESSYNSKAGSKVGALGLWQIMPGTMKMFEGKSSINKREDPVISTNVAMKILKNDYNKIQNWPLTLTAYNHGVNGMLRAINETGSRDLCKVIEHYDSPSFRFASSNFYAQFLAAKQVSMNRYYSLAKKKDKKETSLVIKRTILSSKGGSLK